MLRIGENNFMLIIEWLAQNQDNVSVEQHVYLVKLVGLVQN
jgi:hypothetical protein